MAPSEISAPCLVLDVDLADDLPDLPPPTLGEARCAWVLIRLWTEPLGVVIVDIPRPGLTSQELGRIAWEKLGAEIEERTAEITWSPEESLRVAETGVSTYLESRKGVLQDSPEITIVVCTRERPEGLERCLRSLLSQDYPRFAIVVVDNAPVSTRSQEVVTGFASDRMTYVVEPNAGLSWARNRGIATATGEVIAWIDDDETADRHWLAELARGFSDHPTAGAVSGIMLPAELETWPQVRFEQYGGHNKHRGFRPATYSPASRSTQDPLYPLPPFGTGGNMAFRRREVLRLGGFDVALGAGSPAMGSEDTKAFSEMLSFGGTVVYQPSAVTFHFHRRETAELERQMFGYGVGLTAFYTSIAVSHPSLLGKLFRLVPTACRDMLGHRSLRSGHLPPDFPPALLAANRRGLLCGPGRYLKERWRLWRSAGPASAAAVTRKGGTGDDLHRDRSLG